MQGASGATQIRQGGKVIYGQGQHIEQRKAVHAVRSERHVRQVERARQARTNERERDRKKAHYIFTHNNNGYNAEFVKTVMQDYQPHDDPFTHLPCSSKEYAENSLEYRKQTMIERYGHCDGLE